MIVNFYKYDSSGRIVSRGTCPVEQVSIQAQTGETAVEGVAASNQYYDIASGVLTERPILPSPNKTSVSADGVDAVVWTALPNPTKLIIRGPVSLTRQIVDGYAELTFDYPGQYIVRLESFPYMEQEVVINAR